MITVSWSTHKEGSPRSGTYWLVRSDRLLVTDGLDAARNHEQAQSYGDYPGREQRAERHALVRCIADDRGADQRGPHQQLGSEQHGSPAILQTLPIAGWLMQVLPREAREPTQTGADHDRGRPEASRETFAYSVMPRDSGEDVRAGDEHE